MVRDEIDLRTGTPGPLAQCPRCRALTLAPVTDGETVNFLCETCARCWHVELNWVRRVDPLACPGCRAHARCRAAFAADHPDADVDSFV